MTKANKRRWSITTILNLTRFTHVARIERLNWPSPFKFDQVAQTVGFKELEPVVPFMDARYRWFFATPSPSSNVVVGSLVLDVSRKRVYMYDLGVDPKHVRQGVATLLLTAALGTLEKQTVWLKVDPANMGAIRLYERFGFKSSRLRRDDGLGDQVVMTRRAQVT